MVVQPKDGKVLSQMNANELLDLADQAGIIESMLWVHHTS